MADPVASSSLPNVLLVAIGAVPGAWLRFWLVNQLEPSLPRRHWGTFAVNVSACLLLGLISAAVGRSQADQRLALLLLTGFLGSYSTFSTFSLELLQAWQAGERRQALALLLLSMLAGLLAVALGLKLAA